MTDRMIPTVEDAAMELESHVDVMETFRWVGQGGPLRRALHWYAAGNAENAALAYDMALAQASDARRAEDDRLRSEVAW